MENQIGPNEGRTAPKTGLWVILAVVALILVAAALYFAGVFDTNTNANTNTTSNTNSEINSNVAVNINTPVNQNTNTGAKTNSSTNTSTDSELETSEWDTYSNSDWKISLNYPMNWTLKETADSMAGVVIASPDFEPIDLGGVESTGEMYVKAIPNPNDLETIALIETFSDSSRFWPQQFPYTITRVDDVPSVQFSTFQETGTDYYRTELYVPTDGKVVNLSFFSRDNNVAPVFDSIVNSIQVLP